MIYRPFGPGAILSALLCLSMCFSGFATAADWPQFRGPSFDGRNQEGLLPVGKTFGFKTTWKLPLGGGYSSIAIADDIAVTLHCDEKNNLLLAFDANTGAEKWSLPLGPLYKGHTGSLDGPSGTPSIAGNMVIALDANGLLVAVDKESGTLKWSHQLGDAIPARKPHYGFNTTPTVVDNVVVVMTGAKGSCFSGFDRSTGKLLWQTGDDTSTYQSPIVVERNGQKRILASADNNFFELDPTTGNIFWQAEHAVEDGEPFSMPIIIGENQFLLVSRNKSVAFRVFPEESRIETLWESKDLQKSYALPVFHKGYLFGFRNQFLHCLDATTGKVAWRSRPPGGHGLTLVDDHLLILANDGSLVAVEASGEGYQEVNKLKVFEKESYAPVSFAHGKIYIRNRLEMAAVSITDQPNKAITSADTQELKGAFGTFVTKLQKSNDKEALISDWKKNNTKLPVIEENGLVHYVYFGDVEDVALRRDLNPEKPMRRIDGTNMFFITETLDIDGHWLYHFSVFDEKQLDPHNPHIIDEQNELRMPKWEAPHYISEPTKNEGEVVVIEVGEKKRKISIYLPHGYAASSESYPIAIFPNKDELEKGHLDQTLDHLIGSSMKPIVAVFLHLEWIEMANPQEMPELINNVVLPYMEQNYRIQKDPSSRALIGASLGGLVAAYVATHEGSQFGKLGLLSMLYYNQGGQDLKQRLAEGKSAEIDLYVVSSNNDYQLPGIDAVADTKNLMESHQKAGGKLTHHTNNGSANYGNWRAQMGPLLEWLAPK